jgi:U3 small nucleolar RNA-associated protein 7
MLHLCAFAFITNRYIYDSTGAEAHCIRTIPEPRRMEFLSYHFLLSTVSGNGVLSYHDVTNGKQVATHRTKQGFCDTMAQNPWNAVINLGHASGIVTLWTPNMSEAVVKMQCHQGPSTSYCYVRLCGGLWHLLIAILCVL